MRIYDCRYRHKPLQSVRMGSGVALHTAQMEGRSADKRRP
eukprot:COSAG02_NODE_6847_length_3329_cov_2.747368_1_plen_39_part_10